MQITIPAKYVKQALENKAEYDVLENYSDEVLKAAGITRAKLIKDLAADTKFLAKLEKEIAERIDDDVLYDAMMDTYSPVIADAQKACEKAFAVLDKKAAAERKALAKREEEERVQQTINTLTRMGYKITKA